MRKLHIISATALAMSLAMPAFAQDAPQAEDEGSTGDEIVVTAQRTSQRLQDVPIAVSAFSAEALEKQQIENTSDLQLTLPNITFTKTNFTSSSFTIRGIGDLCVGVSCDQATAIHMNDAPLFSTRLFEGEFFDIGQIEVLRGPQGTLFGRNATSGVVNIKTARPQMGTFAAAGEAEYGNYDSIKVKGMVNVPLGDVIGARIAGYYLKRDGYTLNLYDGKHIDDREQYAIRGSLRFEPTDTTTIDIVGQYFHERDNRLRIQKQLCQRDPTGIMGCLNATRPYETTNANTTFTGVLTSREFFALRGLPTALALGSLYGPDINAGAVNPSDPRVVNSDYTPQYFTDELIIQGSIEQELGGGLNLSLAGNYQEVQVDSSQDYNLSVANRAIYAPALNTLAFFAANGIPTGLASPAFVPGSAAYFAPIAAAIMPGGPNGQLCTSLPEETGTGAFGGHKLCGSTPLDFDRSVQKNKSWTAEAIISSDWDGMFNVLVGGIYGKYKLSENSYYVNAWSIDYFTSILGTLTAFSGGLTPGYLGTPFFRNNSDQFNVSTFGIFGEAYAQFSDDLKLTVGLRYNSDKKYVRARTTLASYLVPFTATDAFSGTGIRGGGFDADPATTCTPSGSAIAGALGSVAGCEAFQERRVKFTELTGRAVLDWNITPDNMVYVSYSRGYKSGGINPPLSPVFSVSDTFKPEFIDAFEIGSKNTFGNGALQLNLTGFYYKYKDLQLSRIVARTSVNDNVSANIWGLEAEAIIRPVPEFTMNIGASYLKTKVSEDKFLANPRDFGGGRADAVIIKDITNGANCAVSSNSGSVAGVNAFVNQVNTLINNINAPGNPLTTATTGLQPGAGLRPTQSFGAGSGLASNGAFSVCAIAGNLAGPLGAAFGGITYHSAGITQNIKGNELPGAPNFKFSAGMQYDFALGDMTLTPRMDVTMTGETFGNIFNDPVNAIDGYWQANAQVQLNGADDKWFVRAFVQNLLNDDAITGLYVTDQSSGNYTNIFTLEPRRYGIAAGFKF
jgi:outer membrane receptor protein involved in Fe transport